MQVDRCPICLSKETSDIDPFVPMCERTDNVKHFAHKTCLKEVFERGIEHCPYQDGNLIPLKSIFTNKEIVQITSKSIMSWAWNEVIDPLWAFCRPEKTHIAIFEQKRTAGRNVIQWLATPDLETRDQFLQNLVQLKQADELIKKNIKGMYLAVKILITAFGTIGSFAIYKLGQAAFNRDLI